MSILKPQKTRQPLQAVILSHNEEEEDNTEVRRRRVSFAGVNKIKEFNSDAESVVICDTPAYEEEFTASSDSSMIIKDLNLTRTPLVKKTFSGNHKDTIYNESDMNITYENNTMPLRSSMGPRYSVNHNSIIIRSSGLVSNMDNDQDNGSYSEESMELTGIESSKDDCCALSANEVYFSTSNMSETALVIPKVVHQISNDNIDTSIPNITENCDQYNVSDMHLDTIYLDKENISGQLPLRSQENDNTLLSNKTHPNNQLFGLNNSMTIFNSSSVGKNAPLIRRRSDLHSALPSNLSGLIRKESLIVQPHQSPYHKKYRLSEPCEENIYPKQIQKSLNISTRSSLVVGSNIDALEGLGGILPADTKMLGNSFGHLNLPDTSTNRAHIPLNTLHESMKSVNSSSQYLNNTQRGLETKEQMLLSESYKPSKPSICIEPLLISGVIPPSHDKCELDCRTNSDSSNEILNLSYALEVVNKAAQGQPDACNGLLNIPMTQGDEFPPKCPPIYDSFLEVVGGNNKSFPHAKSMSLLATSCTSNDNGTKFSSTNTKEIVISPVNVFQDQSSFSLSNTGGQVKSTPNLQSNIKNESKRKFEDLKNEDEPYMHKNSEPRVHKVYSDSNYIPNCDQNEILVVNDEVKVTPEAAQLSLFCDPEKQESLESTKINHSSCMEETLLQNPIEEIQPLSELQQILSVGNCINTDDGSDAEHINVNNVTSENLDQTMGSFAMEEESQRDVLILVSSPPQNNLFDNRANHSSKTISNELNESVPDMIISKKQNNMFDDRANHSTKTISNELNESVPDMIISKKKNNLCNDRANHSSKTISNELNESVPDMIISKKQNHDNDCVQSISHNRPLPSQDKKLWPETITDNIASSNGPYPSNVDIIFNSTEHKVAALNDDLALRCEINESIWDVSTMEPTSSDKMLVDINPYQQDGAKPLSDVKMPGQVLSPLQRYNKNFMEDLGYKFYSWTTWTKKFFLGKVNLCIKIGWTQLNLDTPVLDVKLKLSKNIKDKGVSFCIDYVNEKLKKHEFKHFKMLRDSEKIFSVVTKEFHKIYPFYESLLDLVLHYPTEIVDSRLEFCMVDVKSRTDFKTLLNIKNWNNLSEEDITIVVEHGTVSLKQVRNIFSSIPPCKERLFEFVCALRRLIHK